MCALSRSSLLAPRSCYVALGFLLALTSQARAFTFDDIQFWVGTGSNRAALVIDWLEGTSEPPALVWGYRWDGQAVGRDMLNAVVTADPRLFAKFGNYAQHGAAIYGLGYDANNDGAFEIDDGTVFNAAGVAFVAGPADGTLSSDPVDHYAEGWISGFWRYLAATTNPFDGGAWQELGQGVDFRTLNDGDWNSFAFETTTIPMPPPGPRFDAEPANPIAAPPPITLPGDFNRDGHVDAADHTVWRSTFGSTSQLDADGSGNGIVDAADYVVWRGNLAAPITGALTDAALAVPEPDTIVALAIAPLLFALMFRKEKFQ